MSKPLNQSHILFLSDRPLELPPLVKNQIGSITSIVGKRHKFFRLIGNLHLNWRIRNLHATSPLDAIVVDHPKFISDALRVFANRFNLPIIADNLTNTFDRNVILKTQLQGFILPSVLINGDQTSAPVEAHTAVVPMSLVKSHYWKLAGYKSKMISIALVAIHPDASEYAKVATALDVVKSLDPDITVDIISQNDQDPTPITDRLRKAHLVINVSRDPVWTELAAAAVAAGIPLISPKRPLHRYLQPKFFPGYIIADWQIDTLTTVIQNSLSHPEETYRVAKNAQHWLKSNLGTTFLPLTWLNGLNELLSPDPETRQLS